MDAREDPGVHWPAYRLNKDKDWESGVWEFDGYKMDAKEAKVTLQNFSGRDEICEAFTSIQNISYSAMETLWHNYCEFMVLKVLCNDKGSTRGMLLSTSTLMDKLWRYHLAETSLYCQFMKLIKSINPRMDEIHHSPICTTDENALRMRSTRIAYWRVFGKECDWLENEWSLYTILEEENCIFIKTLCATFSVNVGLQATVLTLKALVEDLKGVEIGRQRYVYRGTFMEDNFLLSDYNIGWHSVLHLVIRY